MAFRGGLAFPLKGQAFLAEAYVVEEFEGFKQISVGGAKLFFTSNALEDLRLL